MAQLGDIRNNQQNTYKLVDDDGQKVAQRTDDPNTQAKLDEIIAGVAGPGASETLQYAGNQNTTPANFPATAAGLLVEVAVICKTSNSTGAILQVSFDAGVNYLDLGPGVSLTWSPKALSQIKVKSNGASVAYDILINRLV